MSPSNPAELAWSMVSAAAELYRDQPAAAQRLRQCLDRFAEPLRIAVAGGPGTGKSTMVNALAGERIAPITVGAGAAVSAWYRDGSAPAARVWPNGGPPLEAPVTRQDRALLIDLRQWQPHQVNRVEVDWPARGLRDMTLIDTPADTSPDWLAGQCDAVVFLAHQTTPAALRPLTELRDAAGGLAAGVNAVLVLCRADEIGAGRIDALSSAKQIARRHAADLPVHAVCQDVVAVAGLLGEAGRTLRTEEFDALRALAAIGRTELDAFLLSGDRFVTGELPVSAETRVALLDRFGLFGVRLSATLIRRGADGQAALAGQLVQRSGVRELRESIGRNFLDRAEVLRTRSALLALGAVLRTQPHPAATARQLATDVERLLAGLHAFRELRLLAALRAGRTTLPAGLDEEAERLVGGHGVGITERLGIEGEPGAARELRGAVFSTLGRWQAHAESPLLGTEQRAAARVVVRTCEGLLAGLN